MYSITFTKNLYRSKLKTAHQYLKMSINARVVSFHATAHTTSEHFRYIHKPFPQKKSHQLNPTPKIKESNPRRSNLVTVPDLGQICKTIQVVNRQIQNVSFKTLFKFFSFSSIKTPNLSLTPTIISGSRFALSSLTLFTSPLKTRVFNFQNLNT